MKLDEIYPKERVGEVVLGMKKEEIVSVLGDRFDEEVDEYGDVYLDFEEQGMFLTLWHDYEYRLGVIKTERTSMVLCETSLFDKSKEETREFIKEILRKEITEEDGCVHEDGRIQEWIDVDEEGLEFWFIDDRLYSIDCSCDWIDDNTPSWPEREGPSKNE